MTITVKESIMVVTMAEATVGRKERGSYTGFFQNVGMEEIGSPVWVVEIDGGSVVIPH